MSYMYMTLSSQEKPLVQKRIPLYGTFFTLFVLSRVSNNTTTLLLKILGDGCMGSPPLGLRLCLGDSPMLKLKCLEGIPRSLKLKCLNCNKFKNYQRKTCTSITFSYISPETR